MDLLKKKKEDKAGRYNLASIRAACVTSTSNITAQPAKEFRFMSPRLFSLPSRPANYSNKREQLRS